jgi:hypothetical protein
MTGEKICPIMSRPFVAIAADQLPYSVSVDFKNDLCYTLCQEEKCMAWQEAEPAYDNPDFEACRDPLHDYHDRACPNSSRCPHFNLCQRGEFIEGTEIKAHCKLIEGKP